MLFIPEDTFVIQPIGCLVVFFFHLRTVKEEMASFVAGGSLPGPVDNFQIIFYSQ